MPRPGSSERAGLPAPISTLAGAVVLLASLLVATGAGAPPTAPGASPGSLEPAVGARVAAAGDAVRPPDTLRRSVEAGTSLILALPEALNGAPVSQYAMLRGPKLSGVAGRSLAWPTRPGDAGTHAILLRALHRGTPTDTLVVEVSVE